VRTVENIALVLWPPVTLILPDAVMVALPLATIRSALWLLPPGLLVFVMVASFAFIVAEAPEPSVALKVFWMLTALPPGLLTVTPPG
jgi:hypothetical protein